LSEEIKPLKIFIGWDSREDIAYQVARQSILENTESSVEIIPIKQFRLRKSEIYTRKKDKLGSTEFTFTRFLVPYLADYKGWALFIDCDFLFLDDVQKLFDLADDNYALMCAKHEYAPTNQVKMDGQEQHIYPRKNWSSMMLINCEHPSNQILTPELINDSETTGQFLHRFQWLEDDQIGEISYEWNWLINWYHEPKSGKPKALHYTEGGPWFENYKDCEYATEWNECEVRYLRAAVDELQQRINAMKQKPINIDSLSYTQEHKDILKAHLNKIIDPREQVYKTSPIIKREGALMGKKVAAIAPDPEDFNLGAKGIEYDPYCQDFILGAGGTISDWDREQNTDNALVIRGLGGTSQKALKHCMEQGRDFYAIDTGYLQPGSRKDYHRVTKNALQNLGPIIERPTDRLGRLSWKAKKFRPGDFILICPPSEKVMKFYNKDLEKWMKETVTEIKKYTDRPIKIRQKPTRRERVTNDTIWDAMEGAHCVLTYNSIAATEALLNGVPAIALAPNAATVLCNTKISEIENLNIPTRDEVTAFAAHLSYCQFTANELRTGLAWEILNEGN
jgi:lipopolysaccharide biosynthesis glycosyltransferase